MVSRLVCVGLLSVMHVLWLNTTINWKTVNRVVQLLPKSDFITTSIFQGGTNCG